MVALRWLAQAIGFSAMACALTLGNRKFTVSDVGERDLLQELVRPSTSALHSGGVDNVRSRSMSTPSSSAESG